MRIHITGASGSGTTTLAAALSRELALHHLDADAFYWLPTDPPFKEKRNPDERLALLHNQIQQHDNLVISGSIVGWGAAIENAFDLIVFLYLPATIRVERLRRREIERYGAADPVFLDWAAQYDNGPSEGRSLSKHNKWLEDRSCRILRLETDQTVTQRLVEVKMRLNNSAR